jgi:hypothetical protein
MAFDSSFDATPAVWTSATALRGMDDELAGRTCRTLKRSMGMWSSASTLAFRFRHDSQAMFVRPARGRRSGTDSPLSELELVPPELDNGAGRSLRDWRTLEGSPLSPRDGSGREDI